VLIRDTVRRLARRRWAERRLFEVLGGWSLDCPEPDVARHLAAQAHHHAWHASLWDERLPLLHDGDPADVVPPGELVALYDGMAAPRDTLERLVGLARVVLPALLAGYDADRAAATPVADAPVLRALGLVITDVENDWRATTTFLGSLVRTGAEEERAAAHQLRLEQLALPLNNQG